MKWKRFTEEQIIAVLKEVDGGTPYKEVCRSHGMTMQTYFRWKSKYGGGALCRRELQLQLTRRFSPATPLPSNAVNALNNLS